MQFFFFFLNYSLDDIDSNIIRSEDEINKSIMAIHLLLIGNEPCVELMNMLSGGIKR